MEKEGLQVINAGYSKTGTKTMNVILTICVSVILVLRDEDKWAASLTKHLKVERETFREMAWWRLHGSIYRWVFNHSSRAMGLYMDWMRPLCGGGEARNFYGENMDVHRLKYRMHNQYVMNNCPKEKLLIWKIEEGWEPICKFLGKAVPDGPLPHENRLGGVIQELANSVDYQAMVRKQTISLVLRMGIIAGVSYGWFKNLIQPHLQVEESSPFNWKMLGAAIAFLVTMRKL